MKGERSMWHTMDTAPTDGTRLLLAYMHNGEVDYDVGMWVSNYGCPGWRAAGTFVEPFLWSHISPLPNNAVRGAAERIK